MLGAMMKRRDALKTIGGLGAAAGLSRLIPGCGGGGGPDGITTYVYMMMENRSYDHFFGSRSMLEMKPGDGLTMAMTNVDRSGLPTSCSCATSIRRTAGTPSTRRSTTAPTTASSSSISSTTTA